MAYTKYIRKTQLIERIRVTELHNDGYDSVRVGPYTDKRMFPRVDPKRSLFIMERETAHPIPKR